MYGLFYKYEEEEAQRLAMEQGKPCPHGNVRGLILKDPRREDISRLLRRELPEDIVRSKFTRPAPAVVAEKATEDDTDAHFFGIPVATSKRGAGTKDTRTFVQYVLEEYPKVVSTGLRGEDIIDTIRLYKSEYLRQCEKVKTLERKVALLEEELARERSRNAQLSKEAKHAKRASAPSPVENLEAPVNPPALETVETPVPVVETAEAPVSPKETEPIRLQPIYIRSDQPEHFQTVKSAAQPTVQPTQPTQHRPVLYEFTPNVAYERRPRQTAPSRETKNVTPECYTCAKPAKQSEPVEDDSIPVCLKNLSLNERLSRDEFNLESVY